MMSGDLPPEPEERNSADSLREGERQVTVSGDSLLAMQKGKGNSVVFLPANVLEAGAWDQQAATLSQHYRVIRYDARNAYGPHSVWGQSERRREYSPVDDLGAVLDAFAVSKAVLVGVGSGSAAALEYTARHPERIAGLVLADPWLYLAEGEAGLQRAALDLFAAMLDQFQAHREPLIAADESEDADQWTTALASIGSISLPDERYPEARQRVLRAATETYTRSHGFDTGRRRYVPAWPESGAGTRLHEITAPARIVTGTIPPAQSNMPAPEFFLQRIPNSSRVEIEGDAEWVMIERPEQFTAVVSQLLHEVWAVQ